MWPVESETHKCNILSTNILTLRFYREKISTLKWNANVPISITNPY